MSYIKYFSHRYAVSLIPLIIILGCLSLLNIAKAAPSISWNTFMGAGSNSLTVWPSAIVADDYGNSYVAGVSNGTWGTPISAHTGMGDIFIAKLSPSGTLIWHTFLGSAQTDGATAIALDAVGNIYITGYSSASWGSNIQHAYSGARDITIAKLNNNGTLIWNTFYGGSGNDSGSDILLDANNRIYVSGTYDYGAGDTDAFLYRFNNDLSGVNAYIFGSLTADSGGQINLHNNGDIVVTGHSDATWGTPLSAYSGAEDVFVAQLSSDFTTLRWHRFLGSSSTDFDGGVAIDPAGNIYVGGFSYQSWGTPNNPHSTGWDGFVTKISSLGGLAWNTFMGNASGSTSVLDVLASADGKIYAGGRSDKSWGLGLPLNPHAGDLDAFMLELDSQTGVFIWNTFLGSSSFEANYGFAMSLTPHGDLFIAADSGANWGTNPIRPHPPTGQEAFVARFLPECGFYALPISAQATVTVCF